MGGRPSGAAKGSNGCSPLGPKKTGPKSQPGVFLAQPPSQNFQIPPAFAMVGHTLDSPPETFVVLESIAFNPWRTHEANDESAIFDGYQSEVAAWTKSRAEKSAAPPTLSRGLRRPDPAGAAAPIGRRPGSHLG